MTAAAEWMLITSPSSWRRLRALGTWAFAEKYRARILSIHPGERAIVYQTIERPHIEGSLAAIIRFRGRPTTAIEKTLFDRLYPARLAFDVEVEASPPVPFRPFIESLEFVSNKSNYGMHLQGQPVKKIPHRDFQLLADAVRASARATEATK